MRSGILATIICLAAATSAAAQTSSGDHLSAMQTAMACAPPTAAAEPSDDSLRVVGSQSPQPRLLFDKSDLLVVNGGTARHVAPGQEYYVRGVRKYAGVTGGLSRALRTDAWIKIVSVDDATALASVTFACGAIYPNDYLEPFVAPEPPPNADSVDTSGDLDFTAPASVTYANDERQTAGVGDFVLIDQTAEHPAASGARVAFYRDPHQAGVPLLPLGEGVVVSVGPSTALVRVNQARTAIENGDYAVRRK